MRITGGLAKGIPIKAPKGRETRPTSDKVREALFQTLGPLVEGTRALDLFAGSGALGIEALSRGADFCFFVEQSSAASIVIALNLAKTRLQEKGEIIRSDFRTAIRLLHKRGEYCQLLLLDPPYESTFLQEAAEAILLHPILASGAVVVAEHFKKTAPPTRIAGINLDHTRFYGQTAISYYLPG